MKTIERVQAWLDNPVNRQIDQEALASIYAHRPNRTILRSMFITNNGISISIQQGATHYCTHDTVEMWNCPHHPILDPYGNGDDPYARVPISVVAEYIDALEAS